MKDPITIYWSSPSPLGPLLPESWLFKDPEPVINYFLENNSHDKNSFFSCPAARSFFKNLFAFKSKINDSCVWPEGYLKEILNNKIGPLDKFGNIRDISQVRESVIKGYIDLTYNARFVMFADKPLKIRISSPSYPPSTPSEGSMFTSGEFDIGMWFRPAILNWFVPIQNTKFEIKENDDLFYVQALTNEKVNFKKFIMTDNIKEIGQYFLSSIQRDGRGLTLEERYKIAEGKSMQEQILDEIKKTVID